MAKHVINTVKYFIVIFQVYLIAFYVTLMQLINPFFKQFIFGNNFQVHTELKQRKVALVTGGSSGIGEAVVKKLRDLNYLVVALVLKQPTSLFHAVDYLEMDLSSTESVRKASKTIVEKYSKVHLLVNCAGVMFVPLHYTSSNTEEHFSTNYLGHFLLTLLCMPSLKSSSNSRIINVTSSLYCLGQNVIYDDVIRPQVSNYSPHVSYATSKLCMILFTYKLQRLLINTPVSAVAYDPGTVHTALYKHTGYLIQRLQQNIGHLFLRSSSDAAHDIVNIINARIPLSTCYKGWMGRFSTTNSVSNNIQLQDHLWDTSVDLTGVNLFVGGRSSNK